MMLTFIIILLLFITIVIINKVGFEVRFIKELDIFRMGCICVVTWLLFKPLKC